MPSRWELSRWVEIVWLLTTSPAFREVAIAVEWLSSVVTEIMQLLGGRGKDVLQRFFTGARLGNPPIRHEETRRGTGRNGNGKLAKASQCNGRPTETGTDLFPRELVSPPATGTSSSNGGRRGSEEFNSRCPWHR